MTALFWLALGMSIGVTVDRLVWSDEDGLDNMIDEAWSEAIQGLCPNSPPRPLPDKPMKKGG